MQKPKQSIVNRSAFLAACALSLALICCDIDQSENCYYDVGASIHSEGARESARVYYPCDIDAMPSVAATTLTNGKGGGKEGLYWLAERIADSGIVVCAVSALDNESVDGYEVAHRAGLGILTYANESSQSPIAGKIYAYGVIGYSIGGGAAVNVASEQGSRVKACIGLSPYNPAPTSSLRAATLILTAQLDAVAPPGMGLQAYEAIGGNAPRAYASMVGQGHLFWWNNTAPGSADDYIIAWLKYWLEENESFAGTLEQPESDMTDVRMDAPPLALNDVEPGAVESDDGGGGGCLIDTITAGQPEWRSIYSSGESWRRWISSRVRR